jgi:hypothetical protein
MLAVLNAFRVVVTRGVLDTFLSRRVSSRLLFRLICSQDVLLFPSIVFSPIQLTHCDLIAL